MLPDHQLVPCAHLFLTLNQPQLQPNYITYLLGHVHGWRRCLLRPPRSVIPGPGIGRWQYIVPGRLQLTQRLHATAALYMATGVMEAEPFAYQARQFVSVPDFIAFKQPANVFYLRGLRQRLLD